jgi:hypothetical protein
MGSSLELGWTRVLRGTSPSRRWLAIPALQSSSDAFGETFHLSISHSFIQGVSRSRVEVSDVVLLHRSEKGHTLRPRIVGARRVGNSHEIGGVVKWFFLPTERIWLNAELFNVNRAPYTGAFTPYTAGMTGWVPMIQTVLAF